ncbi:MAG: hypothetical protein KDI37_07550 [Xanthomonadales bacterium]|nr:hypothetical protein [Xanthomonadales bacterium]
MTINRTLVATLVGGVLFLGGVAFGFAEGLNFGATVTGINAGFLSSDALGAMEGGKAARVKAQLEFELEAGLLAGRVLQENPTWARLGALVAGTDLSRLELYVDRMREYRASHPFDAHNACTKAECPQLDQ